MKFLLSPSKGQRSLRQNISWNLTGNVVYAGCQWGIMVILAKLTNPEMVGRFALGLAVTAPIIVFSQFQLRNVQATDANCEYDFGHYFALRLLSTFIALLVIIAVVVMGGYSRDNALVILAVGLAKAFESISDVFYGFMQRHERMDYIAQSQMCKGIMSLAVMGIVVVVSNSVFAGALGLAITWGIVLLTYDFHLVKIMIVDLKDEEKHSNKNRYCFKPIFELSKLVPLMWMALPLGFVMALISLKTNIPRFFIESYWGASELGVFAALAYLIVAGNTLVSAMGQSCVPRLAKLYAEGEFLLYRRLLFKLVTIGGLIGIVCSLLAYYLGRPLLELIYRPEYAERIDVFIILVISGGLAYVISLLGYGLTATRRFKIFSVPYIILTIITLAISSFMIPCYGLQGAAWTEIVTNLANLVCFLFLLIKTPWRNKCKTN